MTKRDSQDVTPRIRRGIVVHDKLVTSLLLRRQKSGPRLRKSQCSISRCKGFDKGETRGAPNGHVLFLNFLATVTTIDVDILKIKKETKVFKDDTIQKGND